MFNQNDFDQFDEIFEIVKPELKKLSFYKQLSSSKHDEDYQTYRRRIKCRDYIYLDIGFGYKKGETKAWQYFTFLVNKAKHARLQAENIESILEDFGINDNDTISYFISTGNEIINWEIGTIMTDKNKQDAINWFYKQIDKINSKKLF